MYNKYCVIEEYIFLVVEFVEKKILNKLKNFRNNNNIIY